jgi:O-acetyl-ADP-ribose deacetylase (regulator of RNase III)
VFKLKNRLYLDMSIQPIADFYADAIVIPTNTDLDWESDLVAAVRKRAGRSALERAMARGPIELGEALASPGGGLLSTFLIFVALFLPDHSAVPANKQEDLLEAAIINSFLRSCELGIENLGMPNLGKYIGLGDRQSARITLTTLCRESVNQGGSLREVHLVLENEGELKVFGEVACGCSV